MYFLENNINDILVFKKIREIMIKLANAIQNQICNYNKLSKIKTFQLFGIDIILDNNLNPKLLEINKGPNMFPVNNDDFKIKTSIYNDLYNTTISNRNHINGFEKIL